MSRAVRFQFRACTRSTILGSSLLLAALSCARATMATSVGSVLTAQPPVCLGTTIGPRLFVSASHCPEPLQVGEPSIKVLSCRVHPDGGVFSALDIRVCRLEAPAPNWAPISRRPVSKGDKLTVRTGVHPSKAFEVEVMRVTDRLTVRVPPGKFCPGESGAPVFGSDGRLIGLLVSSTSPDCQAGSLGVVNLLRPAEEWLFAAGSEND